MNWLDKNLPLLLAVGSAIVALWSMAMSYARLEQNRKDTEDMKQTLDQHLKDGSKHIDPVRDERRLAKIETAIEEWGDKLDEKFDRLIRMLVDIRNNTKGA